MLNKLLAFIRRYEMVQPGDHVVCALSGGADSVALVYAMKLLAEKLEITVSAAHFNHCLRGAESDADEAFVREFCDLHDIPLAVGSGAVAPGKKGLEAAARNARYAFLKTLPGKIATAHTADDNAETVLMHLVRGTGLKGLGGICPINNNIIRPMLDVTREDVLAFVQEYHLRYVNDSSNATDQFLRNRLRHHVMPLLRQENPRIGENLSAMALRLCADAQYLDTLATENATTDVEKLRKLPEALRLRVLGKLLEDWGVAEPEAEHIALADKLVFSDKPSAKAAFPGGVTVSRCYGKLEKVTEATALTETELPCPGAVDIPQIGLRVICTPAQTLLDTKDCFTVIPEGKVVIRSRQSGDKLRRSGGTKSLKELYIDHKIPAQQRASVPVLTDHLGVLGVYGFGADKDRLAENLPAMEIRFESSGKL
ncbi:MAG: tRNA lysidine(34) synthetase TilS [Oscillospiraceae bacterium]|nr:tRNA lysidine(34) synthetase TilS [Oscillospiraceae bacterium]